MHPRTSPSPPRGQRAQGCELRGAPGRWAGCARLCEPEAGVEGHRDGHGFSAGHGIDSAFVPGKRSVKNTWPPTQGGASSEDQDLPGASPSLRPSLGWFPLSLQGGEGGCEARGPELGALRPVSSLTGPLSNEDGARRPLPALPCTRAHTHTAHTLSLHRHLITLDALLVIRSQIPNAHRHNPNLVPSCASHFQ